MPNIIPLSRMLGLPDTAGVEDLVDAVRELQRTARMHQKRADDINTSLAESQKRLKRAENVDNWCVQFTGDVAYDEPLSALTHGNYVTIEGTGQVIFHFIPCCQNLDCQCDTRRGPLGTCVCAANEPIDYVLTDGVDGDAANAQRCRRVSCNRRVPTSKRPASRQDGFCSAACHAQFEAWGA